MSRFQHQYVGPKPFTRPTYQGIHQMHLADGFVDDCDELLHRCSDFEPLTFNKFTDIWLQMNMGSFYYERLVGAEVAELSEEVIHIAKRYLVANTSKFEESVAGLFMVYYLLTMQPFKGFAALRLAPEDMPAIKRIELVARRDGRHDVLYILSQVLIRGPVQYHAVEREYGFEHTLRKYHEGNSNYDYGTRPKGVFYRQNEELDMIKELHGCFRQYEDIKKNFKDTRGRPDPSLGYTRKESISQLDCSLRRLINGLVDEDIKPETEQRTNRIRDIKSRAMNRAVHPTRHRTTVNNSPQKKPDTAPQPGRAKKSEKRPAPAPADKRKRKGGKRGAIKRQKKNYSDLAEKMSDESDIEDNPEAQIDLERFQTVEVRVEHDASQAAHAQDPDIDELVDKEFNIHIETMPIIIKGHVEGDSERVEIEFIDHSHLASRSEASLFYQQTLRDARENLNDLPDVSFTRTEENDEDDQLSEDDSPQTRNLPSTSTESLKKMIDQVVTTKYNPPTNKKDCNKFRLKRPERCELKKRHLKSKFKKLGLEPLANFEETQKLKKH